MKGKMVVLMKKRIKIVLLIIGLVILLALIFFAIDYSRVQKQEKPIFALKTNEANDGGTVIYTGIGYKIIDFNRLSGYTEMKIGTWFIQYEDFKEEYEKFENNMNSTIKVVVVKVYDNHLIAMQIEDRNELISVGFEDEENIGFKQGQEILIYFDGTIMESYPAQLGNVKKMEILKEKSDIQIPDSILRYCYSSLDNVKVTINELTNSSITLSITDKNELPFNYAHNYKINQKIRNPNYTGVGEEVGEDTKNSTSGYTGTGIEYIWEEVTKISNIESKDTEETMIYNLPNMTENETCLVERKKI